ncbi:hypothetical protein WJX72_008659 [[Myrmecia] bisecta]|uniref:Ran-binding protein 10 n=1 Tax=[Myrmecia] bisecta TaxID=41462 RepID=A0AAW1QFR0_9CHLO
MTASSSSRFPSPASWERTGGRGNTRHLQVNGLRIKYTGPGNSDADAACLKADHPVPADVGVYYFEVTVIDQGRQGFIGVGFCAPEVKWDRLPGWETHSYGYHGDDGNAFGGCGKGKVYGPTFGTGDVIGVILNRAEKTLSYTKNGIELGIAFENVAEERLFPAVGLRTPGEEVVANFGATPFRGNRDAILAEASQRIQARIEAVPLPRSGKAASVLGELIFNHLTHHGHWETAAAVAHDMLGNTMEVSPTRVQEIKERRRVYDLVVHGQMKDAMALTEVTAPGTLQSHPKVAFRLQCQNFVELVREGQDEAAMAFGRAVLAHAAKTADDNELLQDSLSLLAYDDPQTSPCGHLLGTAHRAELASALNSAMLAQMGGQEESALERLYRHAVVLQQELTRGGDPAAALIDMKAVLSMADLSG